MSDLKPCPLCGCPFGGVSEEKPDRHDIDRAALVDVARRAFKAWPSPDGIYMSRVLVDTEAERIVSEYLAEQAGKETQ